MRAGPPPLRPAARTLPSTPFPGRATDFDVNRVKLWIFALLVAAAAAAGLGAHALRLRAQAAAGLDARLAAAAAHVAATTRALEREAAVAAELASRNEGLVEALHQKEAAPPPPARGRRGRPPPRRPPVDEEAQEAALREAARAALASAEKALGFELPSGTVITAGNREWLARKGAPSEAEGEAMAFLRGAIAGKPGRGPVRLNGALFHAVASPAGSGAGLVVLVPVDEAWAKGIAAAAGTDVTIAAPGVKAVSTLRGADASLVAAAGPKAAGAAGAAGGIARVEVPLGPVKTPGLPILLGALPAHRVRAVPFEGLKDGFAVLSVAVGPALLPAAAFEWYAVAGVAVFLVLAIVLGSSIRSREAPPSVPEGLLSAATKIERGDFSARAPALAGKFGTVANALNRAAEFAGPAAAAATAKASVTDEFFARAPGQAAPAPAAAAAEAPFEAALPPPRPQPPAAAPRPPAPQPAPPPPPAAAADDGDEEAHWRQVFQDFLRTRTSCGEPSEGLTYDKFRIKLEGNKAALVSKYACRTVKFQVYVKDGKAALKATPVK